MTNIEKIIFALEAKRDEIKDKADKKSKRPKILAKPRITPLNTHTDKSIKKA